MNVNQGGVLLIDKPAGLTSFNVVERIRRWFRVRKVGHTGTLDPFATGLLVLCLGQATRLAPYVTNWDKAYEGVIKLGEETDTDDPSGKVIFSAEPDKITLDLLSQALERFRGNILQVPPRFSAKKRNGVPSYRRARRGEQVELEPEPVRIDQLEVVSLDGPRARFRVWCSKGTYMRSLARDLGRALGCGGHLAELSRTAIGHLRLDQAVSLGDITAKAWRERDSLLWPAEEILNTWTAVSLSEEGEQRVRYGQDLPAEVIQQQHSQALQEGSCVRLVGDCGVFLAIGRVKRGPSGLTIHPERVWANSG